MRKISRLLWLLILAGALKFDSTGLSQTPNPVDSDSVTTLDRSALEAFFEKHCYECHDDVSEKGNLNLLDLETDLSDAELVRRWVLIHDRIAGGEMPPEDEPRPEGTETAKLIAALGRSLFGADEKRNETVLRRMNREEYENTVSDLFGGIHMELKDQFPEDATALGFDKVGEALSISTEQMQVYLKAADAALDAIFLPEKRPETRKWEDDLKAHTKRVIGKLLRDHEDGVILFASNYSPTVFRGFRAHEPGIYRFRIPARAFQSDDPLVLRIYTGDVISGRAERRISGFSRVKEGKDWTWIEFEERLNKGDSVKVQNYRTGGYLQDAKTTDRPGVLVGKMQAEGPIIEHWPPPGREELLDGIDPETANLADAERILSRLLPLAFRRRTDPDEAKPYVDLVKSALEGGRSWMESLRFGLKGVLCSPEFLFLDEPGRDRISDHALATRLSYFLWSSMPDTELLALADRGELLRPEILRGQVERLLKDPKSEAFVKSFTGQWLDLRDINFTEPDKNLYPDFDEVLKVSMIAEAEDYFREMVKMNRPLTEFIDSDWTILNERLAEHYGIEGVEGTEMRRVNLPSDSVRGGVLTQAAVLKVTANGTNTSPVVRGVWVLENIIGMPTPPPPPSVPGIEPDIRGSTTIREQLDKHRDVESCAVCHRKIDPPGFALESFDVIGGWRDWYRSAGDGERIEDRFIDPLTRKMRVRYKKGLDVDSAGTTPAGKPFEDVREFKKLLLDDRDQIAKCLTEKLLTYSLGRGVGFSDRPSVDRIVANVAKKNFEFRELIHEVVQSETFRQP